MIKILNNSWTRRFAFRGLFYWRKIILCVDLAFLLLDEALGGVNEVVLIVLTSVTDQKWIQLPIILCMFKLYEVSEVGFASVNRYKRIKYHTLLAPLERATIGHWITSSKHHIYASHMKSDGSGTCMLLRFFFAQWLNLEASTDYSRVSFLPDDGSRSILRNII
jgi:hypothetical protein